jgi:hypothetical protein
MPKSLIRAREVDTTRGEMEVEVAVADGRAEGEGTTIAIGEVQEVDIIMDITMRDLMDGADMRRTSLNIISRRILTLRNRRQLLPMSRPERM